VITNYTRNPSRRFSFDVGVDTEQNLVSVQQLAIEVLQKMEGVSKEPPPSVSIEALGDSNVIVRIYGWVNQRKFDYLKVKSEAIRLIKDAFDRAGIGMPEPIYNLKLAEMPVSQPLPKVSSLPKKAEVKRAITDHRGAANVGKDDHIKRQIEQEQQAADVEDLLDKAAPQE
jgi:small-conductance mechanosensitive channel